MKVRIWHGCAVVADLEFPDGEQLPHDVNVGDDQAEVEIDPWARLVTRVDTGDGTRGPVSF
jgi:hypothetical protein